MSKSGDCKFGCSADFEDNCKDGCDIGCEDNSKDDNSCEIGCTASCEDDCKDGCEDGCNIICKDVCNNELEDDCKNTSERDLETDCIWYVLDNCCKYGFSNDCPIPTPALIAAETLTTTEDRDKPTLVDSTLVTEVDTKTLAEVKTAGVGAGAVEASTNRLVAFACCAAATLAEDVEVAADKSNESDTENES